MLCAEPAAEGRLKPSDRETVCLANTSFLARLYAKRDLFFFELVLVEGQANHF